MELRVLQYFLAVAREQSISGAAQSLHLSQPTLSRQLKDMEEELGKQLIIRGNRKITLTEEGILLRKRAEEIIDLIHRTENEIMLSDETITGDIFIGTGETDGVRLVSRAAKELQNDYPGIHYHIASGDAIDVVERIDKGLLDFGILLEPIDLSKYNYLKLPVQDVWGVLMRRDSPLAMKENINAKDLWPKPLILSRQSMNGDELSNWLKKDFSDLNIVATYNLIFNASLMVDEGLGYALCLDKLINTTGKSNLIFKPLCPELSVDIYIVWKKYQVFSKAAEKFLLKLQEYFSIL
jgi:DNA-binding transcriptional LysR family regulator